jgi:hypothetical protein
MWETSIKIPLTPENVEEAQEFVLVDLEFTYARHDNNTWLPVTYPNSLNITTYEGNGWEWEYTTIPIDANITDPLTFGQINANETKWNSTICPQPVDSQYKINGISSVFKQEVQTPVSDRMTVEFWFRPNADTALGEV